MASVRSAVSVNITPPVAVPASREAQAPLVMRMTISKVNFYYGPKQVLFDVSLNIASNKVTSLIGPSGCGKSTLLRTLNRMHETVRSSRLEGEILIDNQNILAQDVTALRRRVGHGIPAAQSLSEINFRKCGLRVAHQRHQGIRF